MEETREASKIRYEIEQFNAGMIPFGSRDIYEAVRTAIEGGHDGDWLVEQIEEFMDSCGVTKLDGIDPCYIAYDGLLQEARNEIDTLLDIDILNDTSDQVYVYGNYMCTSLDYSVEAHEEIMAILWKVSDDDKTPAIKWLENQLN